MSCADDGPRLYSFIGGHESPFLPNRDIILATDMTMAFVRFLFHLNRIGMLLGRKGYK